MEIARESFTPYPSFFHAMQVGEASFRRGSPGRALDQKLLQPPHAFIRCRSRPDHPTQIVERQRSAQRSRKPPGRRISGGLADEPDEQSRIERADDKTEIGRAHV